MSIGAYIAGVTVLAVLPTLFLAARFAAKRTKGLPWSLDDTLLALALIFLYIVVAACISSITLGHVGQRMRTATLNELKRTLFVWWFFRSPMAVELTLTRCAISIFFLRTFYTKMYPWLRRTGTFPSQLLVNITASFSLTPFTAYFCIALSAALGLTTVVGMLLHCRPLYYNWEFPIQDGHHCFSIEPFMIAMAAVGVALDLVTWITPHYVVWGLHLRRAHKVAITAIFAFGILSESNALDQVTRLTGARTIVIGAFRITDMADVSSDGDLTYSIGTNLLWALAQMSTGIIVACLPHLRPAFEKVVPSRLTNANTRRATCTDTGTVRTPRLNSITVTTRIDVGNAQPSPIASAHFHDGHHELWGPTFKVEQDQVIPRQHTLPYREGPPRAVGICCLRA